MKAKIWESAYCHESAKVGKNTKVGQLTHIDYDVEIGEHCMIEGCAYLCPKTRIGNYVFIGPNVTITNDKYPPSPKLEGVTINDHASIGANSTIIAGVIIGKHARIGAGSVVTKNIPDYEKWKGNPARKYD